MPKPVPSRRQASAESAASPAASQLQVRDVERRARQTRTRMRARAADCEDPSLQRLLQRRATDGQDRVAKPAALEPVTAPPLRDAGVQQGDAASAIEAPAADGAEPVLRERIDVSADLLILKTDRPKGFDYRAGQHTKFGVPGTLRTYSIVSAPHEPQLAFFIELIPGGRLSALLETLEVGASVAVGARAKGSLGLDQSRRNHLMVATVTGIAPFISILRDHFHHGRSGHRFIVLTGASYADELAYRAELDAMAAEHPNALVHIPAVSRPGEPRNTGWIGATGRLNGLAAALPDEHGLTPTDTAIYACGHPAMVAQVAGHFVQLGYPVHTEPYD